MFIETNTTLQIFYVNYGLWFGHNKRVGGYIHIVFVVELKLNKLYSKLKLLSNDLVGLKPLS